MIATARPQRRPRSTSKSWEQRGVFSKVAVRERPSGSPACSASFFEAECKQARKLTVTVACDSSCPQGAGDFGRGIGGATATSHHRRGGAEGLSCRAREGVSGTVGGRRNQKQAYVMRPSYAPRRGGRKGCIQRVTENSQHVQGGCWWP
jgi:hypothetical protein